MRAHTRTCPCCNATISAAIPPDDFKCPNGKRRSKGGFIVGGRTTIGGSIGITGPRGPKGAPGIGGAVATININVVGIDDPREVARAINDQVRRQLIRA